jgi:hypothetical protein
MCGIHWFVLRELHRMDFCRRELCTAKLMCSQGSNSRPSGYTKLEDPYQSNYKTQVIYKGRGAFLSGSNIPLLHVNQGRTCGVNWSVLHEPYRMDFCRQELYAAELICDRCSNSRPPDSDTKLNDPLSVQL